jgi:hypothetical protein
MLPRGAPRVPRWLAGALVFASLFWALDLAVLRAGVPDPLDDLWEYGVVAGHLLAGDGFRTTVIHPPLWTLRDPATLSLPVLVHGPLVPLLLAPLLGALGPWALDHAAWLAALLAVLTCVPLVRLGERHFEPAVGAAAAGLLTLSPLTLRAVHHDLALLVGALLLTLALEQLTRARPRALRAGLLLGLGYLARPEMLPAVVLLAPFAGRRWWRFLLGFVACAAAWWWHHALAVGAPLFNLSLYLLVGYWTGRPGLSVLRDFDLAPARWPAVLGAFHPWPKWLDFFPHALKRALLAPSGGTGWLALLGALAGLGRQRARRLALAALLLALLPLLVMTTTVYDERYLVPFLPLWALGAAAGARELVEWLPLWARRPRTWIGALLLLVLPSVAPAMREAQHEARALAARLARERESLAALKPPRGAPPRLLFSDTPDFVAWTTGRPVVWVTREEYDSLPAAADSLAGGAARGDRPRRGADGDTWFHR